MNEMILMSKRTPIEIALDIDATGHTTARKLYAWLELNPANYSHWVKRNITENAYAEEGTDYSSLKTSENEGRGNYAQDYLLTASFAKKLAMLTRTAKGEEAREYFIRVEKALANSVKQMTQEEIVAAQANLLVEHKRQIEALNKRMEAVEAIQATRPENYFTIVGYANLQRISMPHKQAQKLGKMASDLSRERHYEIGKATDPMYGKVNTYHTDILRDVFQVEYPKKEITINIVTK